MNKPLILLVGQSGSGKTTVANTLEEKYGCKQLESYTTRPKRSDNEKGHVFISDEEFSKLENIIAYTEYNGFKYCATAEQIDNSDVYVIDIDGVKTLLDKYNTDRFIYIFYLSSTVATRIDRMIDRGDHDTSILSRLHNDEQYDWHERLSNILSTKMGRAPLLIKVNADIEQSKVVEQIVSHSYLGWEG